MVISSSGSQIFDKIVMLQNLCNNALSNVKKVFSRTSKRINLILSKMTGSCNGRLKILDFFINTMHEIKEIHATTFFIKSGSRVNWGSKSCKAVDENLNQESSACIIVSCV